MQLNDGETVLVHTRPHWWTLAAPTVATLIAATAFGFALPASGAERVALVTCGAALALWAAVRGARWLTTWFWVTDQRLAIDAGILTRSGVEIPLSRVANIVFSQNVLERILGMGDLVIESAGETGQTRFTDVPSPSRIRAQIMQVRPPHTE